MGDLTRLDAAIQTAQRQAMAGLSELTTAPPNATEQARADEWRVRSQRLMAARCRVPDEVRRAVIRQTLDDTEARRALQSWLEDTARKPWLVLSGTSGSGKTVAVADAAARLPLRYMRCEDVVRTFAAMFGEAAEAQQHVLDTRLLAIDDVGAELDAARMSSALLELLDYRVSAADTPTIVTTNLTRKQWIERYGDFRILSRMNCVQWVTLGAERDQRKPK